MKAQIIRSAKREFTCEIVETSEVVNATALAALIKGRDKHLVVGDYVTIERMDQDQYQIIQMDERKNEIFRMIPRKQSKQVIAANCDVVVIISSVSKPSYKQGLVDRYLASCEAWDVPAIIVFNKMDEYDAKTGPDLEFERSRLSDLAVECFSLAAKFPEKTNNDFDRLKESLKGKTAIFLGQSGVGKSKTISALAGNAALLESRSINKSGKGSHTTTWAEVINLENFKLIDSPGVRSFSMDDFMSENFIQFFPDLAEVARYCKFTDCKHDKKTPGCAFFSQELSENKAKALYSRLNSYKKIKLEISEKPDWKKQV